MKPTDELPLFDIIEQSEAADDPSQCEHRRERKTETVWPGETRPRLTMTCEACGRVRGRWPGE